MSAMGGKRTLASVAGQPIHQLSRQHPTGIATATVSSMTTKNRSPSPRLTLLAVKAVSVEG